MFFFFPVRDEYRVRRFPWVVLLIILANVAIHLSVGFRPDYERIVRTWGFVPADWNPLTLLTSQFLHGGILHLAFNMWYLWLLGDNIEDSWGALPFLLFYLAGGVFAGLIHSVMIPARAAGIPAIGASGAIAGVLGAYAVLFPRARITFRYIVFLIWFRTGEFVLYSVFWLAFWFIQQAVFSLLVARDIISGSVAFAAHAGGFVFGLVVAAGARLLRSAGYRRSIADGTNSLIRLLGSREERPLGTEEEAAVRTMRREIARLMDADRVTAGNLYEELRTRYPGAVLPERLQFRLAEALARQRRDSLALAAWRDFILAYPASSLADNALLELARRSLAGGDFETAKNALVQVVVFYPYSDSYEEAKHLLEHVLPGMLHGQRAGGNG